MSETAIQRTPWCESTGDCKRTDGEHFGCHGHNKQTGAPCGNGWGCPHHGNPPWSEIMEPFASLWFTVDKRIQALLDSMDDDELRDVIAATHHLSSTNCWYAAYHVRDWVRQEAERKLRGRGRLVVNALLALASGSSEGVG